MTDHHEPIPDTHQDTYTKTTFGFWIYLVTDFVLFGALFAVYLVLHRNTFGGPSSRDLLYVNHAFIQSIVLLFAACTAGVAGAYAHRKEKNRAAFYFLVTLILGLVFLWFGFSEFKLILKTGHSWKSSAFLSAYFTLIGTHAVHVLFALLWTIVLLPPLLRFGVTERNLTRLTCLGMFWQFINIVWVFIFTIVYLMGGNTQ